MKALDRSLVKWAKYKKERVGRTAGLPQDDLDDAIVAIGKEMGFGRLYDVGLNADWSV